MVRLSAPPVCAGEVESRGLPNADQHAAEQARPPPGPGAPAPGRAAPPAMEPRRAGRVRRKAAANAHRIAHEILHSFAPCIFPFAQCARICETLGTARSAYGTGTLP